MDTTEETQTSIAIAPNPVLIPVVEKGEHVEVTATGPEEMRQCNAALMAWCQEKLRDCRIEIKELTEEHEIAVRNKWRASGLKRQLDKARKRIVSFLICWHLNTQAL